ncbi:hypothetical protein [Thermoactinomyces sp. CICC 10522]|uniref:hypothetical protein n=1 Tax=Thermoactinomyces sp. CICC 10522 TaxID=2767427 RepID=UPI0018DC2FD3|nr:hypothetical protein [Thermoactinomyces sp. CICC 10522]MBH8605910.1 hypothetical protein [Thermoactinomyces sp. CICC 10522]
MVDVTRHVTERRRGKMVESASKIMEWILIISNSILIFWLTYKLNQWIQTLFGIEVKKNPNIDRWAWKIILIGYGLSIVLVMILFLFYYWVFLILFFIFGFAGRKIIGPFIKPFVWITKYPLRAVGGMFRKR